MNETGNEKPRPPVFVVAPARRCGTTLLQRALNSSGTAIIYGENFMFLEVFPGSLPGILGNLPLKKARTREVREQVLAGNYDIDASAMFPDYEDYARTMRSQLYQVAGYYRKWSLSYDRQVWGLKHQIRRAESFAAFMNFFPRARFVFIYRNIFDVARSDRARFPNDYPSAENFAALGRKWRHNMDFMRSVRRDNVLHIEYAEIESDGQRFVSLLEEHCGVPGIKPDVFSHRINVSPVIDTLDAQETKTSYRPPASLSLAEYDALRLETSDHCARFGYPVPSPEELSSALRQPQEDDQPRDAR
ncbi:MAG: sulfotransferase [Hyphomicrobiales bacterium]|nr:sulfotransferase [Hyphomicrobiales bacterium]